MFSLALSAFLTSAESTSELQTLILLNFPSGVDNMVHEARVRWCSINNLPCPGDECSARQRSWDAPGITRDWTTI